MSSETIFYKYMPFKDYARMSLYMMFRETALFFADKAVLNDPVDCAYRKRVDIERGTEMTRYAGVLARKCDAQKLGALHSASQVLATTAPESWEEFFREFCGTNTQLRSGSRNGVEQYWLDVMDCLVDRSRLFSMSTSYEDPLLWAHYGDAHRGFCIGLSIDTEQLRSMGIQYGAVDYLEKPKELLTTTLIRGAVEGNLAAREYVQSAAFLSKHNRWSYEEEHRLYSLAGLPKSAKVILRIPEGEYIRVPSLKIVEIRFGVNASDENIILVGDMWRQARRREPITYLKAKLQANSYKMSFEPVSPMVMSLDRIVSQI